MMKDTIIVHSVSGERYKMKVLAKNRKLGIAEVLIPPKLRGVDKFTGRPPHWKYGDVDTHTKRLLTCGPKHDDIWYPRRRKGD